MPEKSTSAPPLRQRLKRQKLNAFAEKLKQLDKFPPPDEEIEEIIEARQSLRNAAFTLDGDPALFYDALQIYGPGIVLYDWNTLFALHFLRERARLGDGGAKKILQKVGKALSWIGQGRTSPLTKEQKAQRQKKSSQTSKLNTGAAKAAHRAKKRFLCEIRDVPYNNWPEYLERVQIIAGDVGEEEFSKLGKATLVLACASYVEFVASILVEFVKFNLSTQP